MQIYALLAKRTLWSSQAILPVLAFAASSALFLTVAGGVQALSTWLEHANVNHQLIDTMGIQKLYMGLAWVAALVLVVPLFTLGASAARLSARRRDERLASLRLIGASTTPEVLDPQVRVGAQADIFALGVMMYRMLAGRLPFVGLENDQQVLYHNANIEMPPLGDIAPGIDRDMAGIIAWCTRKQPQARPKDATELFASLKEVSESLGESELSWRAPSVPEPTSSLWEAVADIAERSGAGQMVRNTPISAFSDAGDLLAYDVYSPDSLLIGSQDGVHLADVDA